MRPRYANASRHGSQAHDVIDYDPQNGWTRPTNRAGGLEGGVTNGMPLVVRGAAKHYGVQTLAMQRNDVFASGGSIVIRQSPKGRDMAPCSHRAWTTPGGLPTCPSQPLLRRRFPFE